LSAAKSGADYPRGEAALGFAEFIIGPAHRVRPLAGPMAGSDRTHWLNPGYLAWLHLRCGELRVRLAKMYDPQISDAPLKKEPRHE
jgi:hypothetical protein